MLRGAITVFLSSSAVMLVELVAGRLVAPYFGQSTRTWAALTGVTLAGCTLGNALGGRLSGAKEGRRLVCALWFAAAYTAVLPFILPFYAPLGLVGFVCAGWLPLTLALGCATPLVASLVVRPEKNGSDLGALYFFSMIGSMLGSLAGGLYLPFAFPADTLYLALAAVLFATPLILARRSSDGASAHDFSSPAQTTADLPSDTGMLLPIFAVGAVGMAVEMTAGRMVTAVLGGNHVVWSLIFVAFIGWMGVGGYVGGRLADRFPRRELSTVVLGLTGLSISLTSVVQTRVFGEAVLLWPTALRLFVQIVLGFAPVAFMLGAASTTLLKFASAAALARGDKRRVGYLYAAASAGCVAGTFLTGLGLIGTFPSVFLMGVFAVVAAVAALPDKAAWMFAAAAGGIAFCARIPLPAEISTNDEIVVSHRESLYNVVTVTADSERTDSRTIWLDRIPHTTSDVSRPGVLCASYTRMIDAVVRSRCPSGADVFMIGGGGYALPTLWAHSDYPGEFVVAEIDQAVKNAAFRYLAPTLARIESDPKLSPKAKFSFPVADGRAVADTLPEGHFDCVVGDTISDTAIPYHLVTREFNERLKRLLKPGGVSITHTLDTLDSPDLLATLVKTLSQTYANIGVMAYTGVTDVRQSLVVVASDDPAAADLSAAASAIRRDYSNEVLRVLAPEQVAALRDREGAMVLTDRFSPVEKFTWRVMTKDMQRVGTVLGARARRAALDGEMEKARALAVRTLAIEPEQVGAIEAIGLCAKENPEDAEVREILKTQAARPSGLDFAKRVWKWVQDGDSKRQK